MTKTSNFRGISTTKYIIATKIKFPGYCRKVVFLEDYYRKIPGGHNYLP